MDSHQRLDVDVWSPDTDVLLLLMDLVAVDEIELPNRVNLITGKGQHRRSINILDCVNAIGHKKSNGLLGLHNFSGVDWGGKRVGI